MNSRTTYRPGEAFDFSLTLLGKAVDYLPYFVLAFRELAREGIGLNRAPCELERAEALTPENADFEAAPASLSKDQVIYSREEDVFRQPAPFTLADWVRPRLLEWTNANRRITISFLTPTYLKFREQAVLRPDFHHVFKRVRDRLNALCTFFGPGPIDADFKGLGEAAEKVQTVKCDVHWVERYRTSSRTHQRHELSGFVGSCTYEYPTDESGISNLDLFKWILAGELLHVGRHTAWGNGSFKASCGGTA
ncbi:MAG: CRISPR system precrRNA processing endoribonuclease RAMP protein Cas6 [Terriglobia bacterium]